MKKVFAAVGAALLIPAAMFAAAGDSCANAVVIPTGPFPGTFPATSGPVDLTGFPTNNPYSGGVGDTTSATWMVFTAPTTAYYTFSQTNTSFDSVSHLVDASGGCAAAESGAAALLAGPTDTACGGGDIEKNALVLTAGQTVYVLESLWLGNASCPSATADISVSQTLLPPAPGHETCDTAVAVSGVGNGSTTDTATAYYQYQGNLGNSNSIDYSYNYGGITGIGDLWFAFTAGSSRAHKISLVSGNAYDPTTGSDFVISVYDGCTTAGPTSAGTGPATGAYRCYSNRLTNSSFTGSQPAGTVLEYLITGNLTSGNTYYVQVEDAVPSVANPSQTIGLIFQPNPYASGSPWGGDRQLNSNWDLVYARVDGYANTVDGSTTFRENGNLAGAATSDTLATATYTFSGLTGTTVGSILSRPNYARNVFGTGVGGPNTPSNYVDACAVLMTGGRTGPFGGPYTYIPAASRYSFTLVPSANITPVSGFGYIASEAGYSDLLGASSYLKSRSGVGAGDPSDNLRTGTLGAPLVLTPLDDCAFWQGIGPAYSGGTGFDSGYFGAFGGNPGISASAWLITCCAQNNVAGTIQLQVTKHPWLTAGVQDWTTME